MSEVQYTLYVYRDDHSAAIHSTDLDNPSRAAADKLAVQFDLGAFVKESFGGTYYYEDGEVVTRFRLTPLI